MSSIVNPAEVLTVCAVLALPAAVVSARRRSIRRRTDRIGPEGIAAGVLGIVFAVYVILAAASLAVVSPAAVMAIFALTVALDVGWRRASTSRSRGVASADMDSDTGWAAFRQQTDIMQGDGLSFTERQQLRAEARQIMNRARRKPPSTPPHKVRFVPAALLQRFKSALE
ncbi:MAG TPA: hypothetical protein VF221_00685 [Chloroflexota bacterium]